MAFMSVAQAIILGLIQGLTEFIPISSSGHLVLAHHALGVFDHGLAFDVALHFGTLVALLIYFWRDLWRLALAVVHRRQESRLAWLLILATIPAAIIGYLLESTAEAHFRSIRLVATTTLIFGIIMLLTESYYRRLSKHTRLEQVGGSQALVMGLAQAVAVMPGVSRSGSTITAGMLAGLDRVAATRFSFLMGIPIIAGAALKVLTEGTTLAAIGSQRTVFAVGGITALISGWLAIRFMLSYLSRHGLYIFAYYRIGLGLMLLAVFTLAR